jgi:hypothetical protein
MSKIWIPKWKRELEAEKLAKQKKDEEQLKGMTVNDTNFPPLSSGDKSLNGVVWNKKFSTLASEWKTDAEKHVEEEKIKTEFKKSQDIYVTGGLAPKKLKLPQINSAEQYADEEEETNDKPVTAGLDDNTWTLVDTHKVRRKKTIEEREEQEQSSSHEDEGVWKDDMLAEHETCWDDRT